MFSSLLPKPVHSNYDPSKNDTLIRKDEMVSNKRILPTNSTTTEYERTIPLKKKYPNLIHNFPKVIDEQVVESTRVVIEDILNAPQKTESKYEDPMLPPKLKLQKNRHVRLNEEQAPIVKPSSQISKEERIKWEIPAAISNWKNNQGFAIDLNKRMVNQPTLKQEVNIEGFSNLSQALQMADIQAREELKLRNELREKEENNEKRKRQEKIKQIAKRRRY